MPKRVSDNVKGAALALLAFALYATHDAVVKFLGADYSPFQIIFFSTLLGFPLATMMLIQDKTASNLRPRRPGWVAIRTVTAVINLVAGFYAFTVLPLAQAYAVFFAMPLMITLLAIPLLGEKVGLRRGIAVLVGLAGVMIVLRPGATSFGVGQWSALLAAATGALVSVIVRKIGPDERSVTLMLYPMLANFAVMALFMPFVYVALPAAHLGLLALMSALGFGAGLLVIYAYRLAPAVIVAPMQYSQIIWGTIFGAMLFNETPDIYTVIGTCVIVASGIYIVLREGTPAVSENQPVLGSRARAETGIFPRITSLLKRL